MTKLDKLARMYSVVVWYNAQEREWVARCMEFPGAEGSSRRLHLAVQAAYRAVADHLKWLDERNYAAPAVGRGPDWFGAHNAQLLRSLRITASAAEAEKAVAREKG